MALLVICCVGVVFGIPLLAKMGQGGDGADDVKIGLCAPDAGTGWARAAVSIINSDSREHDYFVTVAFEKSGTQIGTGLVVVNDLAAGQSTVDDAVAIGKQGAGYTCRITKVSRT